MKSDISENVILYDWLTVSSKNEDPQAWVKLLGMEGCSWDELDHGRNGYRKGLYFGSISAKAAGASKSTGPEILTDFSGSSSRGRATTSPGWTWPLMIIPVSWILTECLMIPEVRNL